MNKPRQILIYTRPWEVKLHLEIARKFKKTFPDTPVFFATFFSWAAKLASKEGFEVYYLPKMLSNVESSLISEEKLKSMDDQLIAMYDVGLNLMLQSERFLPANVNNAMNFLKQHATVLDKMVLPGTLSISSMFDHFVYWLGGSLANMREGWHFAFVGIAVPGGRALALRTPWEHWQIKKNSKRSQLLFEEARHLLQNESSEKRIEYMKPVTRPSVVNRLELRKDWYFDMRKDALAGSYFSSFSWEKFLWGDTFKRFLKRQPRPNYDIASLENLNSIEHPFFFIPLHLEPEATILMYSPWLRNQLEMCRLCSQALPIGTKLLIKENPKMDRIRLPSFYRALNALPGVRLVAPEVPSIQIIEKSQGVIALAGSAALEAALIGRPSLVFGRPPFRYLLSESDFASSRGFGLNHLSEWMKNPGVISEEDFLPAWDNWISGSFNASVVPRFEGSYQHVDYSKNNASKFVKYILQVLCL